MPLVIGLMSAAALALYGLLHAKQPQVCPRWWHALPSHQQPAYRSNHLTRLDFAAILTVSLVLAVTFAVAGQ